MTVQLRFFIFPVLVLFAQGCAPPSMRSAHSMDKGRVSVEMGQTVDQSDHQADLLTLTGSDTLKLRERENTSVMAILGLGAGFEVGIGSSLMLKYSALDERRQDTPLSVALMLQFLDTRLPTSGSVSDFSGGLLVSHHAQLGASFALRPALNVLYSERAYMAISDIPDTLRDPDAEDSSPTMWTDISYRGIDIPLGLEMPISVGLIWSLAPTISFTYSVPMMVEVDDFSCNGCAFAIDKHTMGTPMRLWFGVRLQPKFVHQDENTKGGEAL